MKVIYGPRCSGKTYELMRIAHETDQYIITPTRREADLLFMLAKKEGMPIRNPVSVSECLKGNLGGTPYAMTHPHGGVLVDDVTRILQEVLHLPKIQAVSVCAKESLSLRTRLSPTTLGLMEMLGREVDE